MIGERTPPRVLYGAVRRRIPQSRQEGRTRQHSYEVLDSNFISTIVHLYIITIQIEMTPRVRVHTSREFVPRVTRRIICEHEDDIGVRDAETFHCAIPALRQPAASPQQNNTTNIPSALAICCPRKSVSSARRGYITHTYPVVKPVSRSAHQDCPIVSVRRGPGRAIA